MNTTPTTKAAARNAARAEYEAAHEAHTLAMLDDFDTPCPERVKAAAAAKDAAWARYLTVRRETCGW